MFHSAGAKIIVFHKTPGSAIDEPVDTLGEALKLLEWFKSNRDLIEKSLSLPELKPIQ